MVFKPPRQSLSTNLFAEALESQSLGLLDIETSTTKNKRIKNLKMATTSEYEEITGSK